jgi:hypothetical protein
MPLDREGYRPYIYAPIFLTLVALEATDKIKLHHESVSAPFFFFRVNPRV